MNFFKSIFSKFISQFSDFSDRGFELREVYHEPVKVFQVSRMWVDKVGWSEGVKKNVVRCYHDGFSFWRGVESDGKEWFCPYSAILKYSQPFKLKSASPIITIQGSTRSIDCMMGNAADYIEELAPPNKTKTNPKNK